MHNDPLLLILILLAASVCVIAAVRKVAAKALASVPSSGDIRLGGRSIVFYALVGVVLFAVHTFLRAA